MKTILESLSTRAKDFLLKDVHPVWRELACDPKLSSATFILTGIYMRLSQLVESSLGSNDFNITPFATKPGQPVRIVQKNMDGRTRRVVIWVDSAVGGPDPTMRVGITTGSVRTGGIRVNPGGMNEIGNIPASKELYLSTDVALNIYVIEET